MQMIYNMRELTTEQRHEIYVTAYKYYHLTKRVGMCTCMRDSIRYHQPELFNEWYHDDSMFEEDLLGVLIEFINFRPFALSLDDHWWDLDDRVSRHKVFRKIIFETKTKQ